MLSSSSTVEELTTPDQAEEIGKFVLDAWREAGPEALGWTGGNEEAIRVLSTRTFLVGLLIDPDRKAFTCREGKRMVGAAVNRKLSEEEVELAGLIVLQDSLGRGFGSMMFDRAKNWAKEFKFRRMIVKTEVKNIRAISFYKSKGFVETEKKIEDVDGMRIDVVLLTLVLSPDSQF